MAASSFDFVKAVAAHRDLVVTSGDRHACRLEPRTSDLPWYCDLDDGTPTGESDPASSVRWVCPALSVGGSSPGPTVPVVDVRRPAPSSDLGTLGQGLGRLFGRASRDQRMDAAAERFAYTDPAGILDPQLRGRIENWPLAPHGDGVMRPAELWSISSTRAGLIVVSVSWWNSAPALDHQLGLALDIARRLAAHR